MFAMQVLWRGEFDPWGNSTSLPALRMVPWLCGGRTLRPKKQASQWWRLGLSGLLQTEHYGDGLVRSIAICRRPDSKRSHTRLPSRDSWLVQGGIELRGFRYIGIRGRKGSLFKKHVCVRNRPAYNSRLIPRKVEKDKASYSSDSSSKFKGCLTRGDFVLVCRQNEEAGHGVCEANNPHGPKRPRPEG